MIYTPPSQQTHIISLSSSKRLCSDIQTSTILHNHKNPWARPSEGTPDGKGGGITQANPQNSCHPSGLIWKCHRPARIHKYPLQDYLHSYKKEVYFFLNFIWTSYHWRLIFQLSMRCRKNTNTKLNIFLQLKTNVYQLSGVWKLKMCFETEQQYCVRKISDSISFVDCQRVTSLLCWRACFPSCLTTFQLRQAWVRWDFVLSHQAHLWRNWMTPVYLQFIMWPCSTLPGYKIAQKCQLDSVPLLMTMPVRPLDSKGSLALANVFVISIII